jgi:hypothetical protein
MSKDNDGGPAFPRSANPPYNSFANGMSLRDYFAGQALAGLLACPDVHKPPNTLCWLAFEYADIMLKARGSDE